MQRTTFRVVMGLTVIILCTVTAGGQAQFEWKPGFAWPGENGLNGPVYALTLADFSVGIYPPYLIAGGDFTMADGVTANHIAKWDDSAWRPLGSGLNGPVYALTVFDDGINPAVLYAAGAFTAAGGHDANNIAKWDDTDWTSLGSGLNLTVYALTVFDDGTGPALYAGGYIYLTDGFGIAKWDGATWTSVGGGTNEVVYALTVFDDGSGAALYAGGKFWMAGGMPAFNIAKWDGAGWTPLGSGPGLLVWALAGFDDGINPPALYAGGDGGGGIAKWDGSGWTRPGGGANYSVFAFTVFDEGTGPALYVGGDFTSVGGMDAAGIAKWTGIIWQPLGSGLTSPWTKALIGFGQFALCRRGFPVPWQQYRQMGGSVTNPRGVQIPVSGSPKY